MLSDRDFEWLRDLTRGFRRVGQRAARIHVHVMDGHA